MTNFHVVKREKQEPTAVLVVRVLLCFALFIGGLAMIGIGAAGEAASSAYVFVGGIVLVSVAFGVPMVGASER